MGDSFRDDPTRIMHVIVLAVFCFLALVAVIFRLWARRVQRSRFQLNDYLCIVGLILALALSIFTIHSNVYWDLGGQMTQYGNPEAVLAFVILQVKALLVGQILWVASVFFIRASVLQLYIHIFRTKSFRTACYIVHGFNFAYFVSIVLAACLICRPISFNWNRRIPGGTCGDQKHLDVFIGVFNLIMDVSVVALPMPVLWGLQLAVAKKIALTGIFSMGIIICIITLIRIWVTSLIRGESNAEQIYSIIALLTCLEALLGVINACLPVMKPIFTKFGNSKLWTWTESATSSIFSSSNARRTPRSPSSSRHNISKPLSRSYGYGIGAGKHPYSQQSREMDFLPSTPSTPHYMDSKTPRLFVRDTYLGSTAPSTRPGSPTAVVITDPPSPPRPPPKSKYSSPGPRSPVMDMNQGRWEERAHPDITMQRDWAVDVERGGSADTDRRLLGGRRSDR